MYVSNLKCGFICIYILKRLRMKKKLAIILCVASAAIMSSGYENYIQEDEIVSIQQAEEYELEITDTTGTESVYEVCMKNASDMKNIRFAVWSEKNGQDDLKWYNAWQDKDGVWHAEIDIKKNHRTAGIYQVHAYTTADNRKSKYLKETTFEVKTPKVSAHVENYQKNQGMFDVVVDQIESASGIDRVRVPVWCADNQADLRWYEAARQEDGTYRVSVNIADHGYRTGEYKIHVYLTAGNGSLSTYVAKNFTVELPETNIQIKDTDGTESVYTVQMTKGDLPYQTQRVRYAVWSEKNGQDDLVWYEASKDVDGTWNAKIDIEKNHRTSGIYQVHTYIITNDGSHFWCQNTFEVSEPTMKVEISDFRKKEGTFDVVIRNIESSSGVKRVQVPVWCADGQRDLIWHEAVKQQDGSYKTTVSIADHDYLIGDYNIHVYLRTNNGILKTYVAPVLSINDLDLGFAVKDNTETEEQYNLSVYNSDVLKNVRGIRFAVWSEKNGQDDLRWYQGTVKNQSTWTATADIAKNHKTAGTYQVHIYVTTAKGHNRFLGQYSFEVSEPSMTVEVTNYQNEKGTFDVVVRDIVSASGIKKIQVPVWCADGQKDLIWYTAKEQKDGSYKTTVSIADHKNMIGDYNIHVYLYAGNGIVKTYVAPTQNVMRPGVDILSEDLNGTEKKITLTGTMTEKVSGIQKIRFAVWSEKDGQDDLTWYAGKKTKDGNWQAVVDIAKNHKTAGQYQAHMYAVKENGKSQFLGKSTFMISQTKMQSHIENYQKEKGTFDIVIDNIESESGIQKVRVPVWCADDQSDLKWYDAVQDENGDYRVTVNVANHKYAVGNYKIHVYMTAGNGVLTTLVSDNFAFGVEESPIHYSAKEECAGTKQGEKRLLFIGNSITLHGLKEYWWAERGMASSTSDKDYVHQVAQRVSKSYDVEFNALNFSEWEKETTDRSAMLEQLDQFMMNQYDYVILQLGENVSNSDTLAMDFDALISYIRENQPSTNIIIVGNFWENNTVEAIKTQVAQNDGCNYISLEDIRGQEYQSAIGNEIEGYAGMQIPIDNYFVAIHPGDFGMEAIAEKIYGVMCLE